MRRRLTNDSSDLASFSSGDSLRNNYSGDDSLRNNYSGDDSVDNWMVCRSASLSDSGIDRLHSAADLKVSGTASQDDDNASVDNSCVSLPARLDNRRLEETRVDSVCSLTDNKPSESVAEIEKSVDNVSSLFVMSNHSGNVIYCEQPSSTLRLSDGSESSVESSLRTQYTSKELYLEMMTTNDSREGSLPSSSEVTRSPVGVFPGDDVSALKHLDVVGSEIESVSYCGDCLSDSQLSGEEKRQTSTPKSDTETSPRDGSAFYFCFTTSIIKN